MILYQALIPLNPKTKKNSQQIVVNRATGRAMIVQSKEYKQYEKDAGFFLPKLKEPIDKPVNVKCVFYRDTKRSGKNVVPRRAAVWVRLCHAGIQGRLVS